MGKTIGKAQIEKLVSVIEGIKFSYKEKALSVLVPRDSIFEFLETFKS